MNQIGKIIGFLALPLILTILAYILFLNISILPQSLLLAVSYLSYSLFLIGMLLGARFNKSKVFFLCLTLMAVLFFLSGSLIDFDILSLLIPINIMFFSFSQERGIFSLWGKLKFGFLAMQAFLVFTLMLPQNSSLPARFSIKLISHSFVEAVPISQLSLLAFLLAFSFLCIRLYLKPNLMESALIGAILTSFIGLLLREQPLALHLFFAMAGIILIIGIVETSYFMAYRDELTGVPGRRALKEAMLKLGNQYTIAMLDIDFFKKFNDTHGHDAGDEVLKLVASQLAKVTGGGKAYRFGGEEFTILFPGKLKNEVIPHLEELRKNIAQQKLAYRKKKNGKDTGAAKQLSVTISIGVAEKSEKLKSPEEVMEAADKALYKAKKNGRNCVCK